MNRRRVLSAMLLAPLAAGCGPQLAPEPVTTPGTAAPGPSPDGTAAVRVYLVRDDRLVPVIRRAPPTVAAMLALLTAGPTRPESATGIRSALPDDALSPSVDRADPRTTRVAVTRVFAELPAREGLLAAAQLVWTLTETPPVAQVEVLLGDRPTAVVTDTGSVVRPVRREDFASVATG